MAGIGVVAIGRNEGERLRRCLDALAGQAAVVVYVDSASTDGSVALARSRGVEVVELDMSIPFSAARARNEGFARLLAVAPDLEFVQFLDGDCEVVPGWLERAERELKSRPELAVVCGRRKERAPEASLYNRLCDLEWDTPVGETLACGGDALMRVSAFRQAGGFNATLPAGEEPELCGRMRAAGWKIYRLDAPMTLHDAAMLHFRQFWRRQVRSGWGSLDVCFRFPQGRPVFLKHCVSVWVWTLGWLLALVAAGLAGYLGWVQTGDHVWPIAGGVVALAILALVPLQMLRIARKGRGRGLGMRDALGYGWLTMLGKWGQLQGHGRYLLDRLLRRQQRLIEYKNVGDPDWQADLSRYPARPFFKEQSIWAIWVYRFGRRVERRPRGIRRFVLDRVYWLLFRVVETLTGISLPRTARIGPGLRIWHFGNIFVHHQAVLGANCTLRQGVTIGDRHPGGPVPVLEDDVELGAYAQVFGGVRVGRGARIGAMSVVLQDVPAGATAVGIPARIMPARDPRPGGSPRADATPSGTDAAHAVEGNGQ